MKMKKLLSGVLAAALSLSLAVPAFASGTEVTMDTISEGATVEVTGSTNLPKVKISVPATGAIMLNPYRLEYKATADATADKSQVISAPSYIISESDLKVKVSAAVTGVPAGVELAAAEADLTKTENAGKKMALVNFQMAGTKMSGDPAKPTAIADWTDAAVKSKTIKANEAVEIKDTDAITLDVKGGSDNTVVAYRFDGKTTDSSTTPWTADDTVGANIAFTFELVANAAS